MQAFSLSEGSRPSRRFSGAPLTAWRSPPAPIPVSRNERGPNEQPDRSKSTRWAFCFNAIAGWVNKYREAVSARAEFANCGADEVANIARDIGVSPEELLYITNKGRHAADELARFLRALGVDPQKVRSADPALMRSLERVCATGGHKDQCRRNLSAGTATTHYRHYVPTQFRLRVDHRVGDWVNTASSLWYAFLHTSPPDHLKIWQVPIPTWPRPFS